MMAWGSTPGLVATGPASRAWPIAWPRSAVYDSLAGTKDASGHVIPGHWYWQYIAILFIGIYPKPLLSKIEPSAQHVVTCVGDVKAFSRTIVLNPGVFAPGGGYFACITPVVRSP